MGYTDKDVGRSRHYYWPEGEIAYYLRSEVGCDHNLVVPIFDEQEAWSEPDT